MATSITKLTIDVPIGLALGSFLFSFVFPFPFPFPFPIPFPSPLPFCRIRELVIYIILVTSSRWWNCSGRYRGGKIGRYRGPRTVHRYRDSRYRDSRREVRIAHRLN